MTQMGNRIPQNIYITSFTPQTDLKDLTLDTGLSLSANNSFVVCILTHDLIFGVANQLPNGASYAGIITYTAQGSDDYTKRQFYQVVKQDGTNNYYSNGQIEFVDGVLTLTKLYSRFISGCRYDVVIMV